jgi:hypothetical protein
MRAPRPSFPDQRATDAASRPSGRGQARAAAPWRVPSCAHHDPRSPSSDSATELAEDRRDAQRLHYIYRLGSLPSVSSMRSSPCRRLAQRCSPADGSAPARRHAIAGRRLLRRCGAGETTRQARIGSPAPLSLRLAPSPHGARHCSSLLQPSSSDGAGRRNISTAWPCGDWRCGARRCGAAEREMQ